MGLGMEFRMRCWTPDLCQSGWRGGVLPGDNEEMVAATANMNDAVCVWSDVHMEAAGRADWIRWVPPDINWQVEVVVQRNVEPASCRVQPGLRPSIVRVTGMWVDASGRIRSLQSEPAKLVRVLLASDIRAAMSSRSSLSRTRPHPQTVWGSEGGIGLDTGLSAPSISARHRGQLLFV